MRKNKETIILAEIRRLIRRKARQYKLGDELGSMHFWSNKNYQRAKRVRKNKGSILGNYPYYSKSKKAIEALAEEIYEIIQK